MSYRKNSKNNAPSSTTTNITSTVPTSQPTVSSSANQFNFDSNDIQLNRISVISDFPHSPNGSIESSPPLTPGFNLRSPSPSVIFKGGSNNSKLSATNHNSNVRRWSSKSSRSSTSSQVNGSRRSSDGKRVYFSKITRQNVPTLRQSFLSKKRREYEGNSIYVNRNDN